ncbi:N,N-dimethylformamidase beta subunit family domain-containing protein [Brevirhabdus sp.]|uniref:N,N-dimethylformamidase beta subunit family domain-containing protein n=1 Tax=Brevirhabdus sp. TaxID=2004514 RepID=UPI00405A27CE
MKEVPLAGYGDRLSARPGERVAFRISSLGAAPVRASLHRVISADPNPDGPGMIERPAERHFAPREVPSRRQPFRPGSCGLAEAELQLPANAALRLSARVKPTLRRGRDQVVLNFGRAELVIAASGAAVLRCGGAEAVTPAPLTLGRWHALDARIGAEGDMVLDVRPLDPGAAATRAEACGAPMGEGWSATVGIAARPDRSGHFNGRIEAPAMAADDRTLAAWDFAAEIPSARVPGNPGPALALVNFPTRAVTGSTWDGTEMCWRHAPGQYAAIHFHEDDIYDFGWEDDFTFTLPRDIPSGAYVMRLECEGAQEAIPLFVCPPRGQRRADLCVVIPSFTYVVYGNHARPEYDPSWLERIADWGAYPHNPAEYRDYGLSTYNTHADGSGICHASHLRPLFNMRPGFSTFGASACSGLRHFPADTHLLSWLHAKGIDYDILTDAELHAEGAAVLEGYAAVTTTTHPEYHTAQTLDALQGYRDGGGALMYLGGNGFYWRIARHREHPDILEIRRAEDGIRAWAAEPGEYYNAFDGTYGGLWRRNGRPPQALVGIGFAAQGEFHGAPYRRRCHDAAFDWVFDGIRGEILGDFGYSGGGAAGFELDHIDTRLGEPGRITPLARSVADDKDFMLVPEEQLTHLTNLSGGPEAGAKHADMVLIDCPGGGRVFATGSITFCGSLPWNGYDNDISRLLENVLRRFLADGADTGAQGT